MSRRWKNFFFGLVTVAGTCLVLFGIGEVAVYWKHGERMALFPRYVTQRKYNDYTIRGNIPNAVYWHKSRDGRWQFRINNHGFRSDAEYDYPKPEGKLRVLVLGDSFTAGYEVEQNETYASVLEKELRNLGIAAEVINAGVSGFSNAEELVFLEQEGVRYHPDVVVLGFYFNDLTDNVRTGLYALRGEELVAQGRVYAPATKIRDFLNSFFVWRWLSEHSYLHNYLNAAATRAVVGALDRKREAEIVGEANAREYPSEAALGIYRQKLACRLVEKMRAVASSNGSRFLLMEIPAWSGKKAGPSFPSQACSPLSVSDAYVDMLPALRGEAPGEIGYRPHGHGHWTPVSHRLAGETLARRIAQEPISIRFRTAQR